MRVDTQPQFLIELIAENIPREYERVDEIAKAYEMVALADLNLARAFRTQDYTYWKYAFLFMGRGVAAAKAKTYKKFARYTNSTVYGKLSKSRKNKNLIESVTSKMSKRLHTSPLELQKQIPFYTVMFQDNERAYDFKEYFKLEDDDVKLFRSRKIPASIEKKRIKELQKLQKEEEKAIQKAKKEALKKEKEASKVEDIASMDEYISDETDDKLKTAKKSMANSKTTPENESIEKKSDTTDKKSKKSSKPKKSNNESKTVKEDKKPKSKQTTLFDF
jgi:replication factor C large subunit